MAAPRLLAIMGSGETTATMVPVHRSLLEHFPARPRLAILDTPYGFQENADELTARTVEYFRTSLPMAEVAVASLRSPRLPAAAREMALDSLRRADVVFSGPGSPSYALRVWQGTAVPEILKAKLGRGALTMASAASVTLGRFSLPVYEVYKVGADPHWLDGLDVLGSQGIPAVVVPHWNNAEGGTHDTSRCWLGARRFDALASRLPPGLVVLGIDEHTAAVLDFAAGRLEVAGKGTVTRLSGGEAVILGAGEVVPLDFLSPSKAGLPAAAPDAAPVAPPSPRRAASYEQDFTAALKAGDHQAALEAVLELEDAHQGWPPAEAAAAHDALRAMVTRTAALGPGAAARVGVVEALLGVRARARQQGRWDDADALRRALHLLAVEVHDTPEGTTWEPAAEPGGD